MQLFSRRYGITDVVSNSDQALFSWPIPRNTTINSFTGEIHVMRTVPINVGEVSIFGIETWLMPLSDEITDLDDMNSMWDTLVPKDNDLVDLDQNFTIDTNPFKEVGEISVSQLFGQERVAPLQRVFQYEGFLSFARTTSGFVPGTPPANTFIPSEIVPLGLTAPSFMPEDGALITGFASPLLNFTPDNNIIAAGRLDQFYILRFLDDFIDNAQIQLTGLTEAGAESPYEDIMQLILNFLEKVSVESGAHTFLTGTYTVAARATLGMVVEGSMSHTTMGPDGQAS